MYNIQLNKQSINEIRELIERSRQIAVTAHMSPDGDAMGSALALTHILNSLGKNARVIVPDDFSKQLSFLPGAKDIIVYCRNQRMATDYLRNCSLIFCLDYNDLPRIDRLAPAVKESQAKKVMIDHHLSPGNFCDVVISQPQLSSTCMLLFITLHEMGMDDLIDNTAATCLLAGMMTDTGNFSYNSNDPDLYKVISKLMQRHVNHDELSRRLFDTFSENCMRLNAYAISKKMQVWRQYGAALITLTRDELNMHHYTRGDTEGLVNKPLAIPGVEYSCFMREEERYIKVSMRSIGEFPCDQICAEFFNGGGHLNAAGGEFFGSIEQAIEVFKRILPINKEKYLRHIQN